jgi:dTDP-4-dehydrorhamnose reductase
MRVLVTGARGRLGTAIVREFSSDAEVHAPDRQALDITDARAVHRTVEQIRPDVVINCAAFNDVDAAQERVVDALEVNAFAVLTLGRAAQAVGGRFVHYSTDFVFDGETASAYTEADRPNPRSSYGLSKLLGEWFALAGSPSGPSLRNAAFVLRVESLFGPAAARLGSLDAILANVREGTEVSVFVDRTVSPSYTVDVAEATRALLERDLAPGLYHCVNSGAVTWKGIAEEVARLLGRPLRLKPMTLESAQLKAPRPRFCALSNAKLAAAGIVMPDWKDALTRYLGSAT